MINYSTKSVYAFYAERKIILLRIKRKSSNSIVELDDSRFNNLLLSWVIIYLSNHENVAFCISFFNSFPGEKTIFTF